MKEAVIIHLGPINGPVFVTIKRKKIKNIHLKVFRTLEVVLSVPEQVPKEWIVNFLQEKTGWIDEQITKYKKSSGFNNLTSIRNGSSTQFLGKDMRIYKTASIYNRVKVDAKRITLLVCDVNNDKLAQNVFNKWWRSTATDIYQHEIDKLYLNIFKKYEIAKPTLIVKKMKTLWGSCSPTKGRITLNEYLLKADIRCIQYVILHELTHFIYPNHSQKFYDFLTIQMPDWKERKERLDTEVVQGL